MRSQTHSFLTTQMSLLLLTLLMLVCGTAHAHTDKPKDGPERALASGSDRIGFAVPAVVEDGDTIPLIRLRTLYVYAPLNMMSKRERQEYARLIRDVKRTLPFARIVSSTLVETYEYIETLPTEQERDRHLRRMEKELFRQYKPELKKLTLRQGKLLLKLIDRECASSSYQLIDAFLGSFSAHAWNLFARMFGASLKTSYDPEGEDALTERVVVLVENGQL